MCVGGRDVGTEVKENGCQCEEKLLRDLIESHVMNGRMTVAFTCSQVLWFPKLTF